MEQGVVHLSLRTPLGGRGGGEEALQAHTARLDDAPVVVRTPCGGGGAGRLLHELAVLRRLNRYDKENRRRVVRCLGVVDPCGALAAVQEPLTVPLAAVLARKGRGGVGQDLAKVFVRDLFVAVRHLQDHNVVHTRLSPRTVYLTAQGTRLKLAHFEDAIFLDATAPEDAMGIPEALWAAPPPVPPFLHYLELDYRPGERDAASCKPRVCVVHAPPSPPAAAGFGTPPPPPATAPATPTPPASPPRASQRGLRRRAPKVVAARKAQEAEAGALLREVAAAADDGDVGTAAGVLVQGLLKEGSLSPPPRTPTPPPPAPAIDDDLGIGDASASQNAEDGARVAVGYCAPEQLLGAPAAALRHCDMWSVGCVLYELLTGAALFDHPEADANAVLTAHISLRGQPVPKALWRAALPSPHFVRRAGDGAPLLREANGGAGRVLPCCPPLFSVEHLLAEHGFDARAGGAGFERLIDACLALDPAARIAPSKAFYHEAVYSGAAKRRRTEPAASATGTWQQVA